MYREVKKSYHSHRIVGTDQPILEWRLAFEFPNLRVKKKYKIERAEF